MYIVTFYSFKGGVGRSMSLVNVGVQLAKAGRRVLLVDFDLEAPGLPTFSLAKPNHDTLGLVDYISQYTATGEAPDASEYYYKSEQFEGGGGIWIMPVGLQDNQYSQRLNCIDWQQLYEKQSGYLFFEDLKNQWKDTLSPDYVLIDSRTGHSDVEGICTRQLPDAVSLLFFPNEQNLQGLKRIVSNISIDNKKRSKPIDLHFAVSNVPDLDDEDHILRRTMERFKTELGYKELATEIHHYNSLSLLNQEIFSLNRPNSRLTKEYHKLTQAIRSKNLEDRDAVLIFLKNAHRDMSEVMEMVGPRELSNRIENIRRNFSQDGEIYFNLARLQEQLGSTDDALSLLTADAVQNSYATAAMFAARVRLNHKLGHTDEAIADLKSMLNSEPIDLESFLEAMPIIDQLAPTLYDILPTSKAFLSLAPDDRMFFVIQSEGNENQLRANVEILKSLRELPSGNGVKAPSDYLAYELALASIGIGDFESAIKILQPNDQQFEKLSIPDAFNLAMAYWGRDKNPNIELLTIVANHSNLRTSDLDSEANYAQCLAITFAALKDYDKARFFLEAAKAAMKNQPRRLFSAWTYSKVSQKKFLAHLEQIEKMIAGEQISPEFIYLD